MLLESLNQFRRLVHRHCNALDVAHRLADDLFPGKRELPRFTGNAIRFLGLVRDVVDAYGHFFNRCRHA